MKIINAHEAVALIKNGASLATGGFGCCGHPEALTRALADRFAQTAEPRDLTLIFGSGQGDRKTRGLNRLAEPGLLRRVIGGYWDYVPRIAALAQTNAIEAYNLPQGIISRMFRATAAQQPGYFSRVGVGTFIDPELGGGRLNARTTEPLLSRIALGDQTCIQYPSLPIDVSFIRATFSDPAGNLVMNKEALYADAFALAAATHNSGGIVIAQVSGIAESSTIDPREVRIPGFLVDYVCVDSCEDSDQTYDRKFDAAFTTRKPQSTTTESTSITSDARRTIALRAAREIDDKRHRVVNLGIGIPVDVGTIIRDSSLARFVTLTIESGAVGGQPVAGLSFGAATYPDAILDQNDMFDLYDGGSIDVAFLGFGQIDRNGRVNAAKLGSRFAGVGGFVNIAQSARSLVFCGTFTTKGLDIFNDGATISIRSEGLVNKFVNEVDMICFDPRYSKKEYTVITERCVLQWQAGQLVITEIARGIRLHEDILALLPDGITVSDSLRSMPIDALSGQPV